MNNEVLTPDEMLAIPAVEISDLSLIPPAPLVSVIVVTYNQEAYIAETIEGILAQQCDFPLELIIGEDQSADQTLEICLNYQKSYPHLIRVVTGPENVGSGANFLRIWARARGRYVAICEGDDYWIDPAKLAKQVALMEQYPETSLCGARTQVLDEVTGEISYVIGAEGGNPEYSLKDVVTVEVCHTSTFLLRKSAFGFNEKIRSLVYIDLYLLGLSIVHGGLRCLPEVVSVYRQHPGGIHTGRTPYLRFYHHLAVCQALSDLVEAKDARYLKIGWGLVQYYGCHQLLKEGRTTEARQLAQGIFGHLAGYNFLATLLLLFRVHLPRPYAFIKKIGEQMGINGYIRRVIISQAFL